MKNAFICGVIGISLLAGCQTRKMTVENISWGKSGDQDVRLFTLRNSKGMEVRITNYGGIITYIGVPDKNGQVGNVVLGFDNLQRYEGDHPFFGSMVGRYANRIGKARFTLDGTTYPLYANDGENSLHGGKSGFNRKVFTLDTLYASPDSSVLRLSYKSIDREEGYPGNLNVQFTYILNERNELELIYDAETDKPTVLNLTNHSYFNLNGCKETVLNEDLTVYADSITPVDSELIPTGAIAPVTGTPFDFTTPHRIGDRIDQVPGGYDINYVLRKSGPGMSLAAEVYDTLTGRLLQVYTTQPGVQVYTGNFLNGSILGYQGIRYVQHDGLCLETQHFPDSPNEPRFPSVVLHPGEKFHQATLYRFSIR